MAIDATKMRPMRKWVTVKADPRVKKTPGGIHLTDALVGVERVMEGTGRILRVGSTAARDHGLEPGMRICFRGFLKDASSMQFDPIDDCPVFMLNCDDIMAVISDDVRMGAFS